MLRPEDCNPGVEVMCINGKFPPPYILFYSSMPRFGLVYRIRELSSTGKTIRLEEIVGRPDSKGQEHGFVLSRFKLLDPNEIQQFYDFIKTSSNVDIDVKEDA